MKKSALFLTLLVAAALSPATVNGAAGYLYESDNSTGTIFQFTTTASGTVVKITFATGLTGVRGLAFDHAGNLFVGQSETIVKITPAGFTSVFASGLHGPDFIAVNRAGDLFLSDRDGDILRYTPQGIRSVFVSGLNKPTGLAFDFEGNLFVADFGTNVIYKITPAGDKKVFALNMKGPQGLAFDKSGILYVVNGTTGTVEAFTPVGSRFIKIFNLVSPVGLALDDSGNFFVAENCSGNANRIQKFSPASETGTVFASGLGCPLQLAFEPPRDPLFNISTRARLDGLPNHELIGGFIVTGTAPKIVLIRGIGPSLSKSGIAQPLMDPTLELHTQGGIIFNDNWMDSQKDAIQSTGAAPKDDREAAIIASLDPGNYTVILRGKAPFQTGIGSVEMYDLNVGADSTLANLSSRGFVQTGDNRMIAGLIVGGGNGAGKVLIRALGPSLGQAGVTGFLPDPTITLNDANGTQLAFNDDWADTQPVEIEATGIPPSSSLESAIVAIVVNGSYTAIVQDVKGNSGVGLVEVYNLR